MIGERWTLLIIRELLLGSRRFGDLLDGLPGIGPNLLSARLKRLEAEGLVARELLPPPAGSRVYALTERGRGLEEPVLGLARWGMEPIEAPRAGDELRPAWYALAMQAAFRPERAVVEESYQFDVDGETFHLRVAGGSAEVAHGPARDPAFVLSASVEELLAVATGSAEPRDDQLEGDRAAVRRFVEVFRLPLPTAAREPRRSRSTSGPARRRGRRRAKARRAPPR